MSEVSGSRIVSIYIATCLLRSEALSQATEKQRRDLPADVYPLVAPGVL
jgi:hypothetical protein